MRILTRLTRRGSASVTSNSMPSSAIISPRTGTCPARAVIKPSQGIDLLGIADRPEISLDRPGDFAEIGTRIDKEASARNGFDFRAFVLIMFILDVADDHFHDVLDRREAFGAAIFVDDERHMGSRRLHFYEKIERRHRCGNEEDRAQNIRPATKRRPIRHARTQQLGRRFAFRLAQPIAPVALCGRSGGFAAAAK